MMKKVKGSQEGVSVCKMLGLIMTYGLYSNKDKSTKFCPQKIQVMNARTHTRAHTRAHTHAHTRARTHTRARAQK